MKKQLMLVVLLCTSVSFGYAQLLTKAGISMASTSSEEMSGGNLKEKLKAGFVAGVGYNIQLGNFSIQPELLFIQKGTVAESSVNSPPVLMQTTTKYTLNYLEMPVLFKYSFGPESLRIYTQFGPSFAVGLGGKGSYNGTVDLGNGPLSESYDFNVKFSSAPDGYDGNDEYIENKTDTGLQLGGGVVIAKRLVADIRYGLGFTDWGNQENTKNRALQISVGFLIGR